MRRTAGEGRKSPLGTLRGKAQPERREAAISGHSPTAGERLLMLLPAIKTRVVDGNLLTAASTQGARIKAQFACAICIQDSETYCDETAVMVTKMFRN